MSDPTLSFSAAPLPPVHGGTRLVLDPGGPKERTLELKPGAHIVGTGQDADVRITDPHVSRAHAKLEVGASGVDLEDLGSSNGTWVNGVKVKSARVTASAVIVIGRTTLRIDMEPEPIVRHGFGEAVGSAPSMLEVFEVMHRLAPTDLSVTLIGETGTGKDVLAPKACSRASCSGT